MSQRLFRVLTSRGTSAQWGSWNLHATAHNDSKVALCDYKLSVGVKLSSEPTSAIQTLETFDCGGGSGDAPAGPGDLRQGSGTVTLLFDASTRATGRIRGQAADFQELMVSLDAQTAAGVHGKPPSLTPIFAGTFDRYHAASPGTSP